MTGATPLAIAAWAWAWAVLAPGAVPEAADEPRPVPVHRGLGLGATPGAGLEAWVALGILAARQGGIDAQAGLSVRWRGVLGGAFIEGAAFPGVPSAGPDPWVRGDHVFAAALAGASFDLGGLGFPARLPIAMELGLHRVSLGERSRAAGDTDALARLPFAGLRLGTGARFAQIPSLGMAFQVSIRRDLRTTCLHLGSGCRPAGGWSLALVLSAGLEVLSAELPDAGARAEPGPEPGPAR